MSKRYNEILNKGNKPKSGLKNLKGRKINPDRIKRDKEGLGIKYTKLSLNFLGANCRSINNKQARVSEILESSAIDVGVFSELNTRGVRS